jgi:hypothetical protein
MKTVKAAVLADKPVTDAVLEQAIERGQRRAGGVQVARLSYQAPCLHLGFEDGSAILLPVSNYPELAGLSEADLLGLELGFSGTALCHKDLDLHVAIAGLIAASQPLMELAGVLSASRNGRQSSAAKAQAARLNGKKGGRPRKVAEVL